MRTLLLEEILRGIGASYWIDDNINRDEADPDMLAIWDTIHDYANQFFAYSKTCAWAKPCQEYYENPRRFDVIGGVYAINENFFTPEWQDKIESLDEDRS